MTLLKFALIGCGKVAVKHLKAVRYHRRDLALAALVDTRPEAAAALLAACGFSAQEAAAIPVFPDTPSMLAAIRPDLVAITTPSGTHYDVAGAAITAGAHVLVEKPLTLSLAQADDLLARARNRGVKIAVGHIYRFFPVVQALEADLRAGVFGRILAGEVKVRWGHDQAYYDQAAWRGTWEQDGGALMNQSIHALDLMAWLLGSPVTEASGWIDRLTHRMEAEDFGLAMLRLASGSYCQIEGTTCTDPARQEASFYILGTEGEIRGGLLAGKPAIKVLDKQGRSRTGQYLRRFVAAKLREGGLPALLQLKNPHSGLYGDLIRAIREDRAPIADGESGRAAVELVLAIYQSARTKRPAALPVRDFTLDDMRGYFDHEN
jgi:UDP-N-acetyl-2-amino-2-deoxyglucuronate dehydrogenase